MKRIFIQSFTMAVIAWVLQAVTGTQVAMAWQAAAIGAGLSVLSSLYGGHKAGEANQRAQRYLDRYENAENAWYTKAHNLEYADTAAGQNLIRKMKEYGRNVIRRADGAARVAGATLASTAKAKDQANNMVGNTIANIAANDTARQDRIDLQHRQTMNHITQQRIASEQQKAQNITYAASQASNALMNAGATLDSGEESFWDGLTKHKKNKTS